MSRLGCAAAGLTLALLGACASSLPPRPSAVERLQTTGPSPWREDFGDPVLKDLLARADHGALDIKTALAQLERADAQVQAARGARGLTVSLGADAATGYAVHDSQRSGLRSGATPFLAIGYEADLFKRLATAIDAAGAERRASQADSVAARLLIGAETAKAYVALRLAQAQERQGEASRTSAERALGLTRLRAKEHRAGPEDLAEREQALSDAEAQVAAARLDAQLQRLRLAALTGHDAPLPQGVLPEGGPIASIDSRIVDQRPDVMAAYARLQAADAQRAVAVAAERPRFQIGLSLGSVDPGVLNLLDARSLAWAAAASLSHDILDSGRGAARIRIAAADADLAEVAYRKASLQGWTELQSSFAQAQASEDDLARARLAAERSRRSLVAGRLRHSEGVIDGVGLSELEGRAAVAEGAVYDAQARALTARLSLALARGG